MESKQKIWVVVGEDRGCGPSIEVAFYSKEEAEKFVGESCNYYIQECDLLLEYIE